MSVPELGVNQQQNQGTMEILRGDGAREGVSLFVVLVGKAGLEPGGGPWHWLCHSCPTQGDRWGDTVLPGMAPSLQKGRC